MGIVRRLAAAAVAASAFGVAPAPAGAQLTLFRTDGVEASLGGYGRWLGAGHDRGWSGEGARRTALQAAVARLRWTVRGERWVVEFHDRFDARWSSQPGRGAVLGLGVSAIPGRADLESVLVDRDRLRIAHDLDRAALTVYTAIADVTVGRQAVTWGLSALFPVADLWSRCSPWELDTDEKPGVDAVRVLAYPGEGLELDVVAADRGPARDASVGVRLSARLPGADVYVAAGKLWREALAMGGVAFVLDAVKLRGEVVVPHELDGGGWSRPRATAGADWIRGGWSLATELHYNGIGAARTEGYGAVLADPRLARGETYFLGRWYAGAAGTWEAADRVNLSASALANLADGSASIAPTVSHDVGGRGRLSGGALLTLGERPVATPAGPVVPASEFGTYGQLLWVQAGFYF